MAKMSSIVGTTGSMGISLTREQAPWTSIEVEIEYQGNWMHCTEAYSKWWDKQVHFRFLFFFSSCLIQGIRVEVLSIDTHRMRTGASSAN